MGDIKDYTPFVRFEIILVRASSQVENFIKPFSYRLILSSKMASCWGEFTFLICFQHCVDHSHRPFIRIVNKFHNIFFHCF